MSGIASFLAGFGGGLMQGHTMKKREAREQKDDAWKEEQRDRQRKEDAEKDKLKQDLADAAAPRTTMQGIVTDGGGNRYLNADAVQAASMQDTLAAEAELKGESVPTQQPGTGVVGAMSRGNEITTEPVDTSKVNSADARNERVLGALRSNGQVERAMSMEGNMLDQQAKRLGLDVAQAKFADEQFNRKLTERLSSPNWGEEAAKMLDETEVGSLAGVTVTSRPTKDGKSIELVGVRDGKEKVVGTFENSDAGRAKFMQQVARVPLEAKIGWIVESEKSAREEQRWQQTFDFNKKKEENDQQYRNRVLSIQMAQESRARQTHALAMEDAKIPPAVKLQAQTLAKQMETINSALSKAMAEGSFDANNPASADLIKQQRVLGLKYQNLLTPYTPGAQKNADPLGLGGGETPAAGAPASTPAAATTTQQASAPVPRMGIGGGAMPPAAAPAAAPAPAKEKPTVAQVLAGPSADPTLLASAQQKAQVVEQLAGQIKAAQAAVAQTARANPAGVGPAMQQVAAARAELTKALAGMNDQQAAQVLAAVGLQ